MDNIPSNRHKPYLRQIKTADTAILFVHGIFGSPVQFDAISSILHTMGYSTMSILLSGHGRDLQSFCNAKSSNWQREVEDAIVHLKSTHKHIILVGHSLGGLLALNSSLNHHIDGIVLMSVPVNVMVSYGTVSMTLKILLGDETKDDDFLKSYRHAYSVEKAPLLNHIKALPQMIGLLKIVRKTRRSLASFSTPALIIQSKKDETVKVRSAITLNTALKGETKLLLLDKSGHCFYHIDEADIIYQSIIEFVKKHSR